MTADDLAVAISHYIKLVKTENELTHRHWEFLWYRYGLGGGECYNIHEIAEIMNITDGFAKKLSKDVDKALELIAFYLAPGNIQQRDKPQDAISKMNIITEIASVLCDIDVQSLSDSEKTIAAILEKRGIFVKKYNGYSTIYEIAPGDYEQTIVINLHGGCVQDIYSKDLIPVNAIVVDWDNEGVSDKDVEQDSQTFKAANNQIGRSYSVPVANWNQLKNYPEIQMAVEIANGLYNEPINATYVSEWSDGTIIRSNCMFNVRTRHCYNIERYFVDLDGATLVCEYVETPLGEFRENVSFDTISTFEETV